MKNRICYLFLGVLIVSILALSTACTSKGDDNSPLSTVDESSAEVQLNGPYDTTPSDTDLPQSPNPGTSSAPGPSKDSPDAAVSSAIQGGESTVYDFESGLKSWEVSNWESSNDGELGFKGISISKEQKASGSSSAAIACNITGSLGVSKTTKGAIRLIFPSPKDLTGKTLTAKVFIPYELFSMKYKSASYGIKAYIKTTSNWTWVDGGWIDIANEFSPGWNEIKFSPKGVMETQTMEIGFQVVKGDKTPDWTGTIYFDDIAY